MPSKCLRLLTALSALFLACNLVTEGSLGGNGSSTLELYGNFHSMGVIVTLADGIDTDEDAIAAVAYRSGRDRFRAGFPLSRVSRTRFVGSLFWLEPHTSYEVRITFGDADDDRLDGTTLSATAETRVELAISPASRSYYAAPAGSGRDCTLDRPCPLREALQRAQAGEEVILRAGTYYIGDFNLPRSGTASAPIVIRSFADEQAILDGADPQRFQWSPEGGGVYRTTVNVPDTTLVAAAGERLYPYQSLSELRELRWGLPGFYAAGDELYVHLQGDASPDTTSIAVSRYETAFHVTRDYIAFLGLTFRHFGRVSYAKAIFLDNASDILVQNSTFYLNNQGINIKGDSHRITIQDNEFHDSLFGWQWDAVKKGGAQFVEAGGVFVNRPATGRGTVIRRNTFHDMFDGLHACPTSGLRQTSETDIYDNRFYRMGDDGLETDGECSNVRIWGNTIYDVLNGISLSPVNVGPVYALRNLIYDTGAGRSRHDGSPFKFIYSLSSDGPVYLFHNTASTALENNDGLRVGGEPGNWETVVSRNNIWAGTRFALANYNRSQVLDLDYDALFTAAPDGLIRWQAIPGDSPVSLRAFQARIGQELNGLDVAPRFVDPARGNYYLAADSALVDAGVVLPGINDVGPEAFEGLAPDIGAYERRQ